ncbi:hypothetical protein HOLleu_35160 [Holothuria leucospilota]|uniref:Uncharacterized protein n=1 Tax=Holothuria leucospilota TaxID=206669 RepID=A0A9Q0YRK6_HOLLE|nr:hypothetical protein HOLleu_35160 [Holothuria leucospilota]
MVLQYRYLRHVLRSASKGIVDTHFLKRSLNMGVGRIIRIMFFVDGDTISFK